MKGNTEVGNRNPFRYREYYWDAETELYYLNTRYYDPETGRFINADSPALILDGDVGLADKNLYAYCDNNPVNRKDDDGDIWQAMLIGAIVGVAGQYISDVANNISSGKKGADIFKPTSSGRDYLAAGVGGAIAAIPGGFLKTVAVGAIGNLASDGIRGNLKNTKDVAKSAGLGAFANVVGYGINEGAARLKVKRINKLSRTNKKNYLMKKFYKNGRENINTNLKKFKKKPVKQVQNRFFTFRAGVYSSVSSTTAATILSR